MSAFRTSLDNCPRYRTLVKLIASPHVFGAFFLCSSVRCERYLTEGLRCLGRHVQLACPPAPSCVVWTMLGFVVVVAA